MSEAKVEFRITPLGLLGILLTVLFVGLKLTGHIAWSWWWVLGPMWIPLVAILALAALVLVGVLCGEIAKELAKHGRNKRDR